jgi:hypothetical protein
MLSHLFEDVLVPVAKLRILVAQLVQFGFQQPKQGLSYWCVCTWHSLPGICGFKEFFHLYPNAGYQFVLF